MNNIKFYKMLSLALVLTACGWSGGNTEPIGLDCIEEYAQNGGTSPTIQDYLDAGVSGIDSDTKLVEINQVVEGLLAEDVDTIEEVQTLVDALGVEVPEGSVSPSPIPTVDMTPPVITLTGVNPMSIPQTSNYTEVGAAATDVVDGTVRVTTTGSVILQL